MTKMLTDLVIASIRREMMQTETDVLVQGGERAHTSYQHQTLLKGLRDLNLPSGQKSLKTLLRCYHIVEKCVITASVLCQYLRNYCHR